MSVSLVLVLLSLWAVWRPAETVAVTPVLLTLTVLLLVPWAWRRTGAMAARSAMITTGMLVAWLVAATVSSSDRAAAVHEIALIALIGSWMWLASRERPADRWVLLMVLGVSSLSLWAVWQSTVGLQQAQNALADLPPPLRDHARGWLASGRAFASLTLPGHLAVLLATALPLLMGAFRRGGSTILCGLGGVLCAVGLLLARSPLGLGLALVASGTLLLASPRGERYELGRRGAAVLAVVAVLVLVLVVVLVLRADLMALEPLHLRVDNWRSALWTWSNSPLTGVGFAGFGAVSQAFPLEVGNRPAHAHSLPLEWMAEFGVVGVVAFLLAAAWLWRLLCRLWPVRPEMAVAVAVVPLHNLLDFSLYTSAVAVPWALLVGWGLAAVNQRSAPANESRGRVWLVAAAALAVAATGLHATSVIVERSAASLGDPMERASAARRACSLAPWRIDPVHLFAASAMECRSPGWLDEALQRVRRTSWLVPQSAAQAALRAQLQLARGDVPSAVAEAWTAHQLQPFRRQHSERWLELLQALGEETSGAGR